MSTTPRYRALLSGLAALVGVLGLSAQASAQAVFRGKVTSEKGDPLVGATVGLGEMQLSVVTNAQGQYVLTIPAARTNGQPATLTARAIGHKSVARIIGSLTAGERSVDFALATDINKLEEIIVTGTLEGTERGKVPFAVSTLTLDQIPVAPTNPLTSLQGKIPGARVAFTSGKPGSTPEIQLRGPTSINASGRSQGPLIIVDGVIEHVGSLEELGGMDIASVEVVKGAAGSSLYGTQAANGVITITTKRGLTGADRVQFNVRSEYGASTFNSDYGQPVNHFLQLSENGKRFCVNVSGQQPCARTVDWNTEILRINSVAADTVRTPQSITYNAPTATDLRNLFQSNIWPDHYYNTAAQMLQSKPTQMTAIDATGKLGSVGFYVSGQYQNEPGSIRFLNGFNSSRARVNLDYNIRPDLKVSASTFYDHSNNDLLGFSFGSVLRGAPAGTNYLARDSLGRLIVVGGGSGFRGTGNGGAGIFYNPDNEQRTRGSNRFLGSITTRYFPTDWVTFEGTFGYDNRSRHDQDLVPRGYRTQGTNVSVNTGNLDLDDRFEEALNGSLTATFRRKINKDLNGKLRFSGSYDQDILTANEQYGETFRVSEVNQTSNTSTNYFVTSSGQTIKNVGLSSAGTLDYKAYTLEGSFRYDGSSLFGPGHRWAPFGRISGVWGVSDEPFWHVGFLNSLRLRASRGSAGNTPPFIAQYETYTVTATGIALGQAGNNQLRPETTTELEVGTDFELFHKLGVEVTYANAKTKDQIFPVNTPASLGFSSQWQNAGTLLNKTWEVGVTVPVVNNNKVYWQMRGTWDRTRTTIDQLNVPDFVYFGGTAQGTGSFFLITADRTVQNGHAKNEYGNIWGRKFYKTCGDLPTAALQGDCGAGKSYQVNDQGWLVWVGAGHSYKDGITKNLWGTVLPASQSPWGVPLSFGHAIVDRPLVGQPGQGIGKLQILGNVFPKFRFTFTNDFQYKRVTLYALLDGTVGHNIYNQGQGWGLLDFNSSYFDQANKSVETAKPVGYSWRVGPSENNAGTGGFYDILGPNNYAVESGSFAKLREVSLTYKVGHIGGVGDWTVGVTGRNLLTITNYTGFDPEVGAGGGSGAGSTTSPTGSGLINQVDAFNFPVLRTFTFSVSTRF